MNINIQLDLYKIFCVTVRTGNMSAAAKELMITQPAVSMSIKQLEDKLGKRLLIRSSKGSSLTREGAVLYEYLNQAMGLIETAEKKYLSMKSMELGEIRIGASDSIITHYLLDAIEQYVNFYPEISISVTNQTSNETLALLKSGHVDLGFVNLPSGLMVLSAESYDDSEYSGLSVTECIEVSDCLIGGTKFEHLRNGVELRNISAYPLLMLDNSSNSRIYLNKYAANNGVTFKPNIELGSFDLLTEFCKINLGLTFVIKDFSKEKIDNVNLFEIPIFPPIPPRKIGMVKLDGVSLSYAAEAFVKLLKFDKIIK